MHLSSLSNALNEDISYKMNKNSSGDEESVRKSCSAKLEASHGARIMVNEVGVSHH